MGFEITLKQNHVFLQHAPDEQAIPPLPASGCRQNLSALHHILIPYTEKGISHCLPISLRLQQVHWNTFDWKLHLLMIRPQRSHPCATGEPQEYQLTPPFLHLRDTECWREGVTYSSGLMQETMESDGKLLRWKSHPSYKIWVPKIPGRTDPM